MTSELHVHVSLLNKGDVHSNNNNMAGCTCTMESKTLK